MGKSSTERRPLQAQVRARYLTSANAYEQTGMEWRLVKSLAVRHGVAIHWPSRRGLIDAEALDQAIKRESQQEQAATPESGVDAVLSALGLERVR